MAKRVDSAAFVSLSPQKDLLGKTDLVNDNDDLPPGWEVKYSKSRNGKLYYYNTSMKISTWEKPPPSSSVTKSKNKFTNEEEKTSKLKDENNHSSDLKQSGLSLILLHYTKKKDNLSSAFSQKRKPENTVVESPATKVAKSKNTSTVHNSSISEFVKLVRNKIELEESKIQNTSSPLSKKEINLKQSTSIETNLQKIIGNKNTRKKSWPIVGVSTANDSVEETSKSFTMHNKETKVKRNMAVARRRKNKNTHVTDDTSQTVTPTKIAVNKTADIHGEKTLLDYSKNKLKESNHTSMTPVDAVVVKNKNNSGLHVVSGISTKNIISEPINSLHKPTIHKSPSVFNAKAVKQDNRNDPPSYESLLDHSSDYERKLIDSKTSCISKENGQKSSSRFNISLTPHLSSYRAVHPHSFNTSSTHNKTWSTPQLDGNTLNRGSPNINNFAVSLTPNRLSDHDKWYHSPLSNSLETNTRNSTSDYLDSQVDSSLAKQPSPGGADVEQDVEHMEVDEEEILSNLQDIRTQTSAVPNEPRGILTEILTKASTSINPKYDTCKGQIMLVIDTNILISCLDFLKTVLTYNIPEYGVVILVMPWIVMQELDGLKMRRSSVNNFSDSTSRRAATSINFIHSHLVSNDPQLIGQTPAEANEATGIDIECNDDRILQCCLQFQRKCAGSHVVLLTRDTNLANKALIMGIKAASNQTLWSLLKIPDPCLCTDQMNKVDRRRSITGTSDRIKPSNGKEVIETSPELHILVKKGKKLNRSHLANIVKVLQESSTTPLRSSSFMDTNSVITKVTVDHKRLPQTESEKSVIMNKFQAVWKLIYDIKLQVANVVADGKSHVNYNEAVQVIQVVIPLLSELERDFSRCLALSPIILWEHEAEFQSLCTHLNTFIAQAHTSCVDSSQPVEVLQLIQYFYERENRPTLLAGLEQLSGFSTELDGIFKMCS